MKTKDELLALANKYYLPGTIYFCASYSHDSVVGKTGFKYFSGTDMDWITDGNGGCVYNTGKWALVNGINPVELESELDIAREIIYKD